ncbi:gamma-glutamylcyclotransferase family protein [Lachnospiraceae bacterium 45-W7]
MSNQKTERLYIAYGSNLNLKQMARRCPTAEAAGKTYLHNYRLMFRGKGTAVATVEKYQGSKVPVLIWRLQPDDERSLDIYEGYPHLYRKEMLRISINGKRMSAMIYIMNEASHPYDTPSRSYFETIRQGYENSGFNPGFLRQGVLDSVWEGYLAKKYQGGDSYDGNN